jgi:excisionase family DNA binding protein
MEKEICGIKEVAKYLNMSESGVRKLVREKRIPYFRILSSIKFDLKEINKWINELSKKESKNSIFFFPQNHYFKYIFSIRIR